MAIFVEEGGFNLTWRELSNIHYIREDSSLLWGGRFFKMAQTGERRKAGLGPSFILDYALLFDYTL
jgi:hypothetical protein